jgi:hypothetical protein
MLRSLWSKGTHFRVLLSDDAWNLQDVGSPKKPLGVVHHGVKVLAPM